MKRNRRSFFGHANRRKKALVFSDNRISKNALFTLGLGIALVVGYAVLIIISVVTGGQLSLVGGLMASIFMILAFFGVIWGVISFDEIRTESRFKVPGLVLNITAILIGLAFRMMA